MAGSRVRVLLSILALALMSWALVLYLQRPEPPPDWWESWRTAEGKVRRDLGRQLATEGLLVGMTEEQCRRYLGMAGSLDPPVWHLCVDGAAERTYFLFLHLNEHRRVRSAEIVSRAAGGCPD